MTQWPRLSEDRAPWIFTEAIVLGMVALGGVMVWLVLAAWQLAERGGLLEIRAEGRGADLPGPRHPPPK